MKVGDIIKGHYNELVNNEEELHKQRMKICKECALFKMTELGPICNSGLYLNVQTNVAQIKKEDGLKKGCGCRLNAKTRLVDAKCPTGKW